MRTRGILGGIVSLALIAAPGAMAQAPAAQTDADRTTAEAEPNPAADEGQRRGVQAPVRARIKLQLKGIQNGKVDVGKRFKAVGTVGPFVPNQEILLLVKRDGQTIKRLTKPVERGGKEGNIGRFDIRSPKVIKPGDYRVRANKLPTPEQQRALRASRGVEVDYPDLDPGDHNKDVKLFNELLKKKAYYTSNGSSLRQRHEPRGPGLPQGEQHEPDPERDARDLPEARGGQGRLQAEVARAAASTSRPTSRARSWCSPRTARPSTSSTSRPERRRRRRSAGKFPTYRKDYGTNSLGMIHSVYFIRGYATHGYHSVPTYPASHGCLRNPTRERRSSSTTGSTSATSSTSTARSA